MLWAQSTTKDYINAEHKLFSISKSFTSQGIIPRVMFFVSLFIFRRHSTREPAFGRVTYFILRAYTVTGVSHSEHRKKNRESSLVKSPVKPVLSMTVGGCQDSKFLLARKRWRFSIEFSNEPSVTDSDCHLSKPHCTMVSFKTQDWVNPTLRTRHKLPGS